MRIAIVHSFYSSKSPSGENISVNLQIDALKEAGHQVELFSRSTDELESGIGYTLRSASNVVGIGPDRFRGLSNMYRYRDFNPDVVHVHNMFPNFGENWLSGIDVPIVATLHNYREFCARGTFWRDGHDCVECPKSGSFRAVKHACYRDSRLATVPLAIATRKGGQRSYLLSKAAKLIVLNEAAKMHLTELLPGSTVQLLPNFTRSSSDPTRSSPSTVPQWIFAGRLTEEKGLRWLIDAWPINFGRLRIAGSGPLQDVVAEAARREPERFEYIGVIDNDRCRREIACARGLIVPSLWSEGIPTVALEALACGTPLVVSEACSSARLMTSDGAGVIFSINDAPSLEVALVKVEGSGMRMRESALRRHSEQFSMQVWQQRVGAIYQDVVSRSQPAVE